MARRLVEVAPAAIVRLDLGREALDEAGGTQPGDQLLHAFQTDVVDHGGYVSQQAAHVPGALTQ